jgi:hypothetical protein
MENFSINGAGWQMLSSRRKMAEKELPMKMNIGPWDRAIRLVLAAAAAVLLLTKVLRGTLALILGIVAALLFVTAVVGFCSLYALFRISTRKKTSENA